MQEGLTILVNEQSLILPDDIAIPLVITNPAFNDVGDHSLTFNLPNIPENQKILGWPARITTKENKKRYETILKFNNEVLFNGWLIVQSATKSTISAYLAMGNGDFYNSAKDVTLKDIDYGDDVVLGTTSQEVIDSATLTTEKDYPATNYNFPLIYNPDFYGDSKGSNPDYGDYQNYYIHGAGFVLNSVHEHPWPDNVATLSPMLYLPFVIEELFRNFNFYAKGPFLGDADILKTILYNNYDLSRKVKSCYVRALKDSSTRIQGDYPLSSIIYFPDTTTYPNEDINYCWDSSYQYYIRQIGYHTVKAKIKFANYQDWAQETALECYHNGGSITSYWAGAITVNLPAETNLVEYDYEYSFYANGNMVGSYVMLGVHDDIYNTRDFYVLLDSYISVRNDSTCDLNRYGLSFKFTDLVPNKKVNDFLNILNKFFGMVPFFNAFSRDGYCTTYKHMMDGTIINDDIKHLQISEITISKYKPTFGYTFSDSNEEVIDISNYTDRGTVNTDADLPDPITPMEYCLVQNTGNIHITYFDDTLLKLTWKLYTHIFTDVVYGNNNDNSTEEEWRAEANPMLMHFNINYFNLTPKTNQIGNCKDFDTGANDFGVEFVFYHGIVNISHEHYYPFASSLKWDCNSDVVGALNMLPQEMIDRFFGTFFTLRSALNKPFSEYADLDINYLRNVKLWEKFKAGNTTCFISTIEPTVRKHSIEASKITYLPL